MTRRTREALDDCRLALVMLEEETDLRRWRLIWFGAVTLTRTVGQILDKVDAKLDPELNKLSREAYKRWNSTAPEHEIFREFIDKERNTIVKEYQFNIHPSEEVHVALMETYRPVTGGEEIKEAAVFPIGDNIYRPILDGYREGDDARDVMSDAIDWWETELQSIERKLATRKA
jgi:hypothetical protein